jgi:hypothetical protein
MLGLLENSGTRVVIMPQKLAALTIVRQDGFHDCPESRAVVEFL